MVSFPDLLRQIDYFKMDIPLNYKQDNYHRSYVGGLMTIMLFGLVAVTVYFFGKELIQRQQPRSLSSKEYVLNPEYVEIGPKNFPIAFGVQDFTYAHYIDESIYTIKTQIQTKLIIRKPGEEPQLQFHTQEVKAEPCQPEKHFLEETTRPYMMSLPYQSLFCVDTDVPLEGQFISDRYSYLEILFFRCVEEEGSTQKCQSKQVLDLKLKQGKFAMYYGQTLFEAADMQDPFKRSGTDFFITTSTEFPKDLIIYLKHMEETSDVGVIFESQQKSHRIGWDYSYTDLIYRGGDNYLLVNIRLSPNKETFARDYKKFQNVLAQMGGFVKAVTMIVFFVIGPFLSMDLHLEIFNSLFFYQKQNNNDDKESLNQSISHQQNLFNEILRSPEHKAIGSPSPSPKQSLILKPIDAIEENHSVHQSSGTFKRKLTQKETLQIDKVKSKVLSGNDGLQFTICQRLFYFIPCGKLVEQKRNFEKALQKVKDQMDVVYIAEKMHELDKLKHLLLSQKQLMMFDYAPKPIVNEEIKDNEASSPKPKLQTPVKDREMNFIGTASEQEKELNLYKSEKTLEEKFADAYNGYQWAILKEEMDYKDQQLITLLGKGTIKLFEDLIKQDGGFQQELQKKRGGMYSIEDINLEYQGKAEKIFFQELSARPPELIERHGNNTDRPILDSSKI